MNKYTNNIFLFIPLFILLVFLIGGLFAEFYFKFEETCTPDKEKNKVAVVIAKGGIYDTERMNSQVLEYYKSVKKDLNIENAGLKKFEGKTIGELDEFVDNLYLNDDVGYIIFVGDDLPVIREETTEFISWNNDTGITTYRISEPTGREEIVEYPLGSRREIGKFAWLALDYVKRLECTKKDCGHFFCRDVATSFILPPLLYSNDKKLGFVLNILETYTNYHENFDAIIKKYQKSLLFIYDPTYGEASIERDIDSLRGSGLPIIPVSNTEPEKVTAELKEKHLILSFNVHGQPTYLGMGLHYGGPQPTIGQPYSTTLEEYSNFAKENGVPALFFTDTTACFGASLRHPQGREEYCCWLQIYMESGVWANYELGGASDQVSRMKRDFSNEKTIGLALRKRMIQQNFVYGDILAHMK